MKSSIGVYSLGGIGGRSGGLAWWYALSIIATVCGGRFCAARLRLTTSS